MSSRRHRDAHRAEPLEQIGAKLPGARPCLEIDLGRRPEAHVGARSGARRLVSAPADHADEKRL